MSKTNVQQLQQEKEVLLRRVASLNAKLGTGFKSRLKYGKNYRGVIFAKLKVIKTQIKFIDVKLLLLQSDK